MSVHVVTVTAMPNTGAYARDYWRGRAYSELKKAAAL